MARKSYPVLSNLQHDGVDYAPRTDRDRVVIEEKQAGPLLDAGVLGEGEAVVAQEGEERAAALLDFFQTLTIGDFTTAGGLRVDAKRRAVSVLGFEPTEDELKAAAETYANTQAGNG